MQLDTLKNPPNAWTPKSKQTSWTVSWRSVTFFHTIRNDQQAGLAELLEGGPDLVRWKEARLVRCEAFTIDPWCFVWSWRSLDLYLRRFWWKHPTAGNLKKYLNFNQAHQTFRRLWHSSPPMSWLISGAFPRAATSKPIRGAAELMRVPWRGTRGSKRSWIQFFFWWAWISQKAFSS